MVIRKYKTMVRILAKEVIVSVTFNEGMDDEQTFMRIQPYEGSQEAAIEMALTFLLPRIVKAVRDDSTTVSQQNMA